MGIRNEIDIEISNNIALRYFKHEIDQIKTALDSALEQRAKDWEQLQELETQVKGLGIIAKELLTAVNLKHLDKLPTQIQEQLQEEKESRESEESAHKRLQDEFGKDSFPD